MLSARLATTAACLVAFLSLLALLLMSLGQHPPTKVPMFTLLGSVAVVAMVMVFRKDQPREDGVDDGYGSGAAGQGRD